MLIAYALAAGNAGTAFRYRAHLVTIAICAIVTLWQLRRQEGEKPAPAPRRRSSAGPMPSVAVR